MNKSLLKRGPTVVVMVLGLVCTVPYLNGDQSETPAAAVATEAEPKDKATPKEKADPKKPKVSLEKLLLPKLVDRPTRDPFKDPQALEAEAKAHLAEKFKEFIAKNVFKTTDGRFPSAGKASRSKSGLSVSGDKGKDAFDPLTSLSLDATYVLGERGAAMINGELYRPGDAVKGLKVTGSCLVSEVGRDRVVVNYNGKTYPLVYKSAGKKVTVASRKTAKSPVKAPLGSSPSKRK